MKGLTKSLQSFCSFFIIAAMLQACAGMGQVGTDNGWKNYNQNFEKMKSVVQQALRASNLIVRQIQESNEKNQISFIYSSDGHLGTESIPQAQGSVVLRNLGKYKTALKVNNPQYNSSVPNYERKKYRSKIIRNIEDILG